MSDETLNIVHETEVHLKASDSANSGIDAATLDTNPVNTDVILGARLGWIKTTWTTVKAFLKTYFDTVYQAILVSGTNIKTINGASVLGSGDLTVTGSGSGDVTGPASSTAGNLAVFADNTGKVIEDGGPVPTVPTDLSDLSDTTGLLDFPNVQDPLDLQDFTSWEPLTAYVVGDKRVANADGGNYYGECSTPHTSGATFDATNWNILSLYPTDIAALTDTTGIIPTDVSDLTDTTGLLDYDNVQDPINLSEYNTTWETGTAYLFGDKRSDLALGIQFFIRCINPHTSTGGYWAENDTANWALVSYFFADVSALTDSTGVIPTDVSDLTDSTGLIPDITGLLDETAHDALDHTGLTGIPTTAVTATIQVIDGSTLFATGDGQAYFRVPSTWNGKNLIGVAASCVVKSTSGLPTIQIARGRQANPTSDYTYTDTLSTKLTIDANEYDSSSATTAAVIDSNADDLATGDLLRIDGDVSGTGCYGMIITIIAQ